MTIESDSPLGPIPPTSITSVAPVGSFTTTPALSFSNPIAAAASDMTFSFTAQMDLAPGDTVSLDLAGFSVPPTLPAHTDATYAFSVAGRTLIFTAKVAVPRGGAQAVLVPALFGIRLPDVGTGNTRCCARLGTCCVKVINTKH